MLTAFDANWDVDAQDDGTKVGWWYYDHDGSDVWSSLDGVVVGVQVSFYVAQEWPSEEPQSEVPFFTEYYQVPASDAFAGIQIPYESYVPSVPSGEVSNGKVRALLHVRLVQSDASAFEARKLMPYPRRC